MTRNRQTDASQRPRDRGIRRPHASWRAVLRISAVAVAAALAPGAEAQQDRLSPLPPGELCAARHAPETLPGTWYGPYYVVFCPRGPGGGWQVDAYLVSDVAPQYAGSTVVDPASGIFDGRDYFGSSQNDYSYHGAPDTYGCYYTGTWPNCGSDAWPADPPGRGGEPVRSVEPEPDSTPLEGDQEAAVEPPDSEVQAPRPAATRAFAGPGQFPPRDYRAYGIVAFPTRAADDAMRARHASICRAYAAVLPSAELDRAELPPRERQMVTVWPIRTDEMAGDLNLDPDPCGRAVAHYGLPRALTALDHAETAGWDVEGRGPFLLAWSPPDAMGTEEAILLLADLSDVSTQAEAVTVMRAWREDIEADPTLWPEGEGGWNIETLRTKLRRWADLYGPRILRLFGA